MGISGCRRAPPSRDRSNQHGLRRILGPSTCRSNLCRSFRLGPRSCLSDPPLALSTLPPALLIRIRHQTIPRHDRDAENTAQTTEGEGDLSAGFESAWRILALATNHSFYYITRTVEKKEKKGGASWLNPKTNRTFKIK